MTNAFFATLNFLQTVDQRPVGVFSHHVAIELASLAKFPLNLSFSTSAFPNSSTESTRIPAPTTISPLSTSQLSALLDARRLGGEWDPRTAVPDGEESDLWQQTYRLAKTYCFIAQSLTFRCRDHGPALMSILPKLSRSVLLDDRNTYHRLFTTGNSIWTGFAMMRGARCLGGIICTSSRAAPEPADHPHLVSRSELIALGLLLVQQLPEDPDERICHHNTGALVINITPNHIRILEAVVDNPLKPAVRIVMHKNMPYNSGDAGAQQEKESGLPPERGSSRAGSMSVWFEALRWMLFLNADRGGLCDDDGAERDEALKLQKHG